MNHSDVPQKAIVIVSGGMDSSVLLAHMIASNKGGQVIALTVDYGQRHRRELVCAGLQAQLHKVIHEVVDVSGLFRQLGSSCLTDLSQCVPHGHYAEETMKQTVVPNRNMILLSIAIAFAVKHKAAFVAYGAHAGDHAIYPDCRPEFADKMNELAGIANWHRVELCRPFITWTKSDIVKKGTLLGVQFSKTWSCYEGNETACGRCGTCVERLEAFDIAGSFDPLPYADRDFWRTFEQKKAVHRVADEGG
jgi:7-cyano-7-deazaguanine synthase